MRSYVSSADVFQFKGPRRIILRDQRSLVTAFLEGCGSTAKGASFDLDRDDD
jgi:hypothetical protein